MYCISQGRVLPPLSKEDQQRLLTQAHLHTLVELLEAVPDPRGRHGLRYDLPYLLTCLFAALLCHCQSTEAVSECVPRTHQPPPRPPLSPFVFHSQPLVV